MKKLFDKNRKVQMIARLHLSLQKFDNFKDTSSLTQSQALNLQNSNGELSKEINKILQINKKKKSQIKQQLISGPVGIDLNQQMQDLRWRMSILKQNHRKERPSKGYNSLVKKQSSSQILEKQPRVTFNQLYNEQKQKFSALRQRRKTKRMNIQYIEMVGNKQSRRQRNKQQNQERFSEQMRLLDQAIEGN